MLHFPSSTKCTNKFARGIYLKHYRTFPLLFHSIGLSDSQHARKKRTGWSTANNWTASHWWASNWILADKKKYFSTQASFRKNILSWTVAMFYESDFFFPQQDALHHAVWVERFFFFFTSKPLTRRSHFYMPVMFFASESCILALDRVTKGGFVAWRASASPTGLTWHSQGKQPQWTGTERFTDWGSPPAEKVSTYSVGSSGLWAETRELLTRLWWWSHSPLNKTWKLKPQKNGAGVPHILSHKVFCCTWNCCLSLLHFS